MPLSIQQKLFRSISNKYNLLVFILWLAILAITSSILLNQPFLGFTTKIHNDLVYVDKVYDKHLALSPDTQIKAIAAKGIPAIALNKQNSIADPNTVTNTFAKFNQFLAHNKRLAPIFSHDEIIIITPEKSITVKTSKRPLESLSIEFWATAFSALFSSLLATSIFMLRRHELAAQALAGTAIIFMILSMLTSGYTHRIIYLDPTIFKIYLSLQHFFGNWFSFAVASMVCIYPKRLCSKKIFSLIYFAVPLAFWLNDQFQWFDLPFHSIIFNSLIAFVFFVITASLQVYAVRNDPLRTAQIRWFLISLFSMPIIDVLLYILPISLGYAPIIPLWMVLASFTIGFIGLALGIVRYRLFDVERWWFKTWIWLIAGSMLVIIDIILISYIHIKSNEAMILSVIIMAWLYFPARQWLWKKLSYTPDTRLDKYLPILAESVFKSNTSGQSVKCWQNCLSQIFQPIAVETYPHPLTEARIDNNGLDLLIPSICKQQDNIKLTGRNKGSRLFRNDDPKLATAVNQLIANMINIKIATQQAAQTERKRIMRDLHDDVGANLLSMIYRADNDEQAQYARDTLKLLRESIYTLDDNSRSSLNSAIFEWQQEITQRTQEAHAKLKWQESQDTDTATLTARQKINIGRVLREAISNALKHAKADKINVSLTTKKNILNIQITNNGEIKPKENWLEGKGINNMKTRIKELNGDVHWHVSRTNTPLTVKITLPLDA